MSTWKWMLCSVTTTLLVMTTNARADDQSTDNVADTPVPRIILHDILTHRVCLFESKLYSIGAKVIILGKVHECNNASPMTFGGKDADWDMRWMPVADAK